MNTVTTHPERLTILIIGATGTFGSRLARLLSAEPAVQLVLAARRNASLQVLANSLAGARIQVLDRDRLESHQLIDWQIDLVIDASGPFQAMQTQVIEAALKARIHYIDLADARQWVNDIGAFDHRARKAETAVITGASSTPALSHAVLDALSGGWRQLDSITVVIAPGNQQRFGLSVMRAVLLTVGHPVAVFRHGGWMTAPGWGLTRRVDFPGVGRRFASLAQTPDLDLLPERLRPRESALFLASLALPVMHLGVGALGLLVRAGIIRSLEPGARLLQLAAAALRPFKAPMGAMLVQVSGQDKDGQATHAQWSLIATGDAGPHVPTLACVALVRRMLRDDKLPVGARPCVGILSLTEFRDDLSRLGIQTTITTRAHLPVFRTALGADFERLPAVTQFIHTPACSLQLCGRANVEGAQNWIGRLIAGVFGLPATCVDSTLKVSISQLAGGEEQWVRLFAGHTMVSRLGAGPVGSGTVSEQFGPLRCVLQLRAHVDGIDMAFQRARIGPVTLPRFLSPQVDATERANGNRHQFDVHVRLPLLGRLVRYRGWLNVPVPAARQ